MTNSKGVLYIGEENKQEILKEEDKPRRVIKRLLKDRIELIKLRMLVEEQKRTIVDQSDQLKYFHDLIKRDALQAYADKMSPEEIKKWEAL
jgi:hypothetical protein